MSDDLRLCRDCRFQDPGFDPAQPFFWTCSHPAMARPGKVDLLTGAPTEPSAEFCSSARNFTDLCGPKGRYWEPRGFG